jgi:S1-C subfamily serine protease
VQIFTQIVVVIGRVSPNGISMLGTGFFVKSDGYIATTRHVVGDNDSGLVILMPHINNINSYQDTSNTQCNAAQAKIVEIDPIKDLAIIKIDAHFDGHLPEIGGFDDINVSDDVGIFGFPHCVEGRRVLTYQKTEVGAKVLLESSGVKSKYAIINTQARPGQSGSLIFSLRQQRIVGMLNGAYVPEGAGISLGGINPRELHQTTQCISAEYLREML